MSEIERVSCPPGITCIATKTYNGLYKDEDYVVLWFEFSLKNGYNPIPVIIGGTILNPIPVSEIASEWIVRKQK